MVWSWVVSRLGSRKQIEIWGHEDVVEAFWKEENCQAEDGFFAVCLCLQS